MDRVTKTCQNCKQDFIIEPEDFVFYEKIKVPPPTFCPECSHQRRFSWRNTHSLYHRKDSVTGKDVLSIYHPDVKMNVVDQKYWWSDEWDPFDYGKDYDFSKTFFLQWKELRDIIPFQALSNSKAINSEYCNVAEESYDCYLISACWKNERTMYSDSILEIKDSSDLYVVQKAEFCYEDVYCNESSRLFYSEHTIASTDSYFLYDCKGCVNCFMSSNLRNKSYVFENIQYSKDEYLEKISKYDLGSFEVISKLKNQFQNLKMNSIHKYVNLIKCNNVSGDNLSNVVDSKHLFDALDNVKNCKHLFWVAKNIFDCYYCNAIGMLENSFEMNDSGVGGSFCKFSSVVYSSTEVSYSFNCYNCKNIFGCIGLRNKSYCILNKQYSKEEYFELIPKIIDHMNTMPYVDKKDRIYRYGEFFPIEFSPFSYNETVANNFYPLTKNQATELGFSYRDRESKNYNISLLNKDIPDNIKDVSESILDEVIECKSFEESVLCTSAFKITKDELSFYKKLNIPIPRSCYQCRHKKRFLKRNPLKLWHRSCMCKQDNHGHGGKCEVEFETSYAPERPEVIYCEKCYQQEVV